MEGSKFEGPEGSQESIGFKVGDSVDVFRTSKGEYEGGWVIGAILDDGKVFLHKTGDRNAIRNAEIAKLRRSKEVE